MRGAMLLPVAVAALFVAGSNTSMTPAFAPTGTRELQRGKPGRSDQAAVRAQTHLGYSTTAFGRQRVLEQRFRSSVSAERLTSFHAALTRRPHMAGSPGSEAVATYLRQALAEAGFDVEV